MSSHREAPQISQDPVADSTDLYAFVSPDQPDTVTLIANYLPLQEPAGGPNFYEFGHDVQYDINIDNNGDGRPDLTYRFSFKTKTLDEETFLYNTGPITSLTSTSWNRVQTYTVTLVQPGQPNQVLGTGLPCPPCNVGPLSTPNYGDLATAAIQPLPGGGQVFAGQRADGFYVDLGAIFDLGDLRPFENLHNQYGMNVFSGPAAGPWTQVSRLGNPLFNEVLVPLGKKDLWNSVPPARDKNFATYVANPMLASLLNDLYPGVFPNLAALASSGAPRADLEAILLTGIPAGLISGFENYTGSTQADMLRLNTSIPPSSSPNIQGVIGGDLAGYPNGRRVFDDVVSISLRAVAGMIYYLVDSSYVPDAAANVITDGLTPSSLSMPFFPEFPYLGTAYSGFENPS